MPSGIHTLSMCWNQAPQQEDNGQGWQGLLGPSGQSIHTIPDAGATGVTPVCTMTSFITSRLGLEITCAGESPTAPIGLSVANSPRHDIGAVGLASHLSVLMNKLLT